MRGWQLTFDYQLEIRCCSGIQELMAHVCCAKMTWKLEITFIFRVGSQRRYVPDLSRIYSRRDIQRNVIKSWGCWWINRWRRSIDIFLLLCFAGYITYNLAKKEQYEAWGSSKVCSTNRSNRQISSKHIIFNSWSRWLTIRKKNRSLVRYKIIHHISKFYLFLFYLISKH